MVLTLPLCRAIREEFPGCKLTLIARSYVEPLLENCPAIDEAIYIDNYSGGIKEIFSSRRFDAAFFPRPRYDEAMAAFTSKVKLRVGSAYRLYSLLFNHRIFDHRRKGIYHEAEYNVRLLSVLMGKELETKLVRPFVCPAAKAETDILLRENGLAGTDYIILHPGSGGSSRDWPTQSFAGLAELLSVNNYRIITTGIASEAPSCKAISERSPGIVNLCGRLDMRGMIALIEGAKLLVANSTGMLHVAAALGTPVVGLFPNTSEISGRRWGPYSANSAVVSPPDGDSEAKDDMRLISPETVFHAAVKLLEGQKS